MIRVLLFFLFIMELFNGLAHFLVGAGMRMLPYKDMLDIRSYFLFSTLTLATTMLTIDCPLFLLDAVVMGHHIFCYMTWEHSPHTKKVILWSSLNWNDSRFKEPLLFLGSIVAAGTHGYHGYLLGTSIKFKEIVMGLVIAQSAIMAVMYNSKLAWATPGNIPEWVKKRVDSSPVTPAVSSATKSTAKSKKRN